MVAVATGQFDLGGVSIGPAALNAFNRGADLKIIAVVEPPGHGSLLPVVARAKLIDSGEVKGIADLMGRKFALNSGGTLAEYVLAKTLARANLTPRDVDIITMPFPEMVAALNSGAVDAAGINQPLAALGVSRSIAKVLLDDYAPNTVDSVLVANARFLERHRGAITTFLEVYLRAIRRLSGGELHDDEQASRRARGLRPRNRALELRTPRRSHKQAQDDQEASVRQGALRFATQRVLLAN